MNMGYSILSVFFLMIITLSLFLVKRKNIWRKVFYFRIFITVISVGVFVYFFTVRSVFDEGIGSVSVKISNKLPKTLDFYVLRKNIETKGYFIRHYGKIRPNHHRSEYLDMRPPNEYWIIGYNDKAEMVYFTQHFYQTNSNLKIDRQKVFINYQINQSKNLSKLAKKAIEIYQKNRISSAIIITMSLLLLFMNIILLVKRK